MNTNMLMVRNIVRMGCFCRPYYKESSFDLLSKFVHRNRTQFEKSSLIQKHFYSNDAKKLEENKLLRKQFKTIYMFRPIVTVKVLSRFKIYTTAFTGLMIPISSYLYATGQVTVEAIVTCIGLWSFATISLYVISTYIQNIVGMISVNEDKSRVMVSHLSFWGTRIDKVYKTEEIVPFSDTGEDTTTDLYRKMTFFNDENALYLFLPQYGGLVVNKEMFESIFGDLL